MDCEAILVPVDGSGSSRRAVETAIALARACEARIEYLYVADLKDTLHQAEGRNQHHSVLEMAVEEGRQVLNDVLESTPADVPAREIDEASFARQLAHRLNQDALEGRYAHLVLAADPQTLGQIRPHLHEGARSRLLAELPKNYTNAPREQIERALAPEF